MKVLCFVQDEKFEVILLVILVLNGITNGTLLPYPDPNTQEVHLLRCLAHISHRYFAPGQSLVIASPSAYRDVQQELIAEIHRTASWPVVVTVYGNINISNKTNFINRDGSYIISLLNVNIEIFKAEVNSLAQDGTKFTLLWNYKTQFVVAGTNQL
jgi:hypothetical protein